AAIGTSVPPLAHRETELGHVGGAGGAGFWHSLSAAVPSTALLFPSLMKIAAADFGFGFGTAMGSAFALAVSCIRQTRACALILGTSPPKNQGRPDSVALMSMPGAPTVGSVAPRKTSFGGLLAHGAPPLLSPAFASPKYPRELMRMWSLDDALPPTWAL